MYTEEMISQVLKKPELQKGLQKYIKIMNSLYNTNVSSDKEFQRLYNAFYKVRRSKEKFGKYYYDYMEDMKSHIDTLSFEDIFYYLQKNTGNCEASFSSKLLATLRPELPVWDEFVLKNLGVKKIYSSSKNREQKIISAYNKICQWYEENLESENGKKIIMLFDKIYPDYNITNTKKIDLFLWQHRD